MKKMVGILAIMISGCATPPGAGVFHYDSTAIEISENGHCAGRSDGVQARVEIGNNGEFLYDSGGIRARGTCRTVSENVIAAQVQIKELKLTLIGKERSMEWIPRKQEEWILYLQPKDGVCKRFGDPTSARLWKEFQDRKATACLLIGEVKSPGVYSCPSSTTIALLLADAGGFCSYAIGRETRIIRGTETAVIDAVAMFRGKTNDVAVLPSDIVLVPSCRHTL